MTELLNVFIGFPTVIFTVLVGVAILYWVMVIFGAFDVDILDVGGDGAADGALEGAAQGAVEGAAHGAVEGAGESAAEGAAEGAAHSTAEGDGIGGFAGMLSALRLRSAPLTVTLSLIFMFAWLFSVLMTMFLAPLLVFLPWWLVGALVLLVALVLAIPLTSISSRPLGKIFVMHEAPQRKTLIGSVCSITTGRVDEGFGQAELADKGAGLIFQVRCDVTKGLKKGSRALIVSYDDEREAFMVEPYDRLLTGEKG